MGRLTEREALEELKTFPISCLDFKENQALDMAIKALEKQIAKKPLCTTMAKDKDKNVGSIGRCPCCNDIVAEDMLWCDECGQKLDWE